MNYTEHILDNFKQVTKTLHIISLIIIIMQLIIISAVSSYEHN